MRLMIPVGFSIGSSLIVSAPFVFPVFRFRPQFPFCVRCYESIYLRSGSHRLPGVKINTTQKLPSRCQTTYGELKCGEPSLLWHYLWHLLSTLRPQTTKLSLSLIGESPRRVSHIA